jgi:predicted RNase H-like nuclease (RuvC/YqgF family)
MGNMSSRSSRRKWIKKKKSKIDELACTKQKLTGTVEHMEYHIADLQEQLQHELQHVKQEAREAVEARDAYA